MMKKALVLLFVLTSSITYASGKLIFQPYQIIGKKDHQAIIGLSVDQHLIGPAYLSSWIGLDAIHEDEAFYDPTDVTIKNGIRFQFGKFAAEPIVQFSKNLKDEHLEEKYSVKISYQLW